MPCDEKDEEWAVSPPLDFAKIVRQRAEKEHNKMITPISRLKNFHEQHVGIIDFLTAPDYIYQGEKLLSEAIAKAGLLGMSFLVFSL